jgi:hypothetical protein
MGQINRCCHLSKLGVLKLPVREPSLTCKLRAPNIQATNIQATFMWVCLKIIGRLQTHGNSPLLDVHVLGQHQSPVVYRECIPRRYPKRSEVYPHYAWFTSRQDGVHQVGSVLYLWGGLNDWTSQADGIAENMLIRTSVGYVGLSLLNVQTNPSPWWKPFLMLILMLMILVILMIWWSW